MIPFLYNVAQAYYKADGQNISRYTFVFPNRRAGVFFQHYLSQIADKPIFSPQILTIADLFEQLSPYKKADRIEMLFMLFSIYKQVGKTNETFDEFLYWGEMLLNDFDDIDKYLVDAQQLFRNIKDLKDIDAGFSYLSETQIEVIRRFWSNFLPVGENDKKKDFLEMWEVLFQLYSSLRNQLAEKNQAYEGMIFRDVIDSFSKNPDYELPYEKIIFIGLNGHSKSEEKLLSYLHKKGIADFYWDYSSPLVRDPQNKASFFMDKNKVQFPSQLALQPEELSLDHPTVEAIGIPSSIGQAKYVHTIIKSLLAENQIVSSDQAMNTALVLPDENLLLPTLYSIPPEIDKINITMGYSLNNSSVSGLMEHIFELQKNVRRSENSAGFYYKPVLAILNHRYITNIAGQEAKQLRQSILQYNKIIISVKELEIHPLFSLIFKTIDNWYDAPEYLKDILSTLRRSLYNQKEIENEEEQISARSVDIEGEFIVEYYKTINKMNDALQNVSFEIKIETYFKLLKKLIVNISVPFTGEPLSGLQIMGVLETRALDFDNLIILSMNEGIFPLKRATSSFIPYNLRKGFDLPTYEHQDSIFAYHFYRLINRAKRIYLLYDTRTEGLQSGEVSRYFKQIKHLYADSFDIREKLTVYKVSRQVAIQHDAAALRGHGIQLPGVIQPPTGNRGYRFIGVGAQRAAFVVQPQHIRCRVQPQEHALRTVLEKPAARVVVFVVAVDETQDLRIGDGLACAALCRQSLWVQAPAAARIQRQPAEHRGHVGPAGDGVFDRRIHVQGRMMMGGGLMTMAGAGMAGTSTGCGA